MQPGWHQAMLESELRSERLRRRGTPFAEVSCEENADGH